MLFIQGLMSIDSSPSSTSSKVNPDSSYSRVFLDLMLFKIGFPSLSRSTFFLILVVFSLLIIRAYWLRSIPVFLKNSDLSSWLAPKSVAHTMMALSLPPMDTTQLSLSINLTLVT